MCRWVSPQELQNCYCTLLVVVVAAFVVVDDCYDPPDQDFDFDFDFSD